MKQKPKWLVELTENVREASTAFTRNNVWPEAWLYLGDPTVEKDWYDWDEPLLGLPVYHCPNKLIHCGYSGEGQRIVPLFKGDVSNMFRIVWEFECRLARSGDY